MKTAEKLAAICDTFQLHGYHTNAVNIRRWSDRKGWQLNIQFSDFIEFGTPTQELSEVAEFGEDSVPGGYFIPSVHRAGPVSGMPGVTVSGFERVPDYTLIVSDAPNADEQIEALIASFAKLGDAPDWARFSGEEYVSYLTKPGRWLVGMNAKMHAAYMAKRRKK